jgi:RimJ/RimL family protein N-acetyltransferase
MVSDGFSDRAESQYRLIYGYDRELAFWVGDRLGVKDFGPCRSIGVGLNGEIIAAVVYHNCRGNGLEMSIASTSPKWATRKTLFHLFAYPFITQGCDRVTALVDADDHDVQTFDERLGFVREGLLRKAHPNGDAVIYGMLRDECKWVAPRKTNRKRREPLIQG